MALPVKLPFAAVAMLSALFGGGGATPAQPVAPSPNVLASDVALAAPETRGKTLVWAVRTWPLHFRNPNTNETVDARFYSDEGTVDPEAIAAVTRIVNPDGEPEDARVLLLVARAAYFFGATNVEVLSGHRKDPKAQSKHHTGEALDFKLERVDSGVLAAHLRGLGHVGVGIYTHPATRYVHVDSRETSFHWIDSSPPGKAWREYGITDAKAHARDTAWKPEFDEPRFLAVAIPRRK